jgi:hypothetical protein
MSAFRTTGSFSALAKQPLLFAEKGWALNSQSNIYSGEQSLVCELFPLVTLAVFEKMAISK